MNKIYYFHLLLIALFTTVSLQAESVSVNANMPDTWAVLADTDTTQGVIMPPPAKPAALPPPTTVCINEIDSDTPGTPDAAEYIELSGTPNGALDHFVVVLFNGANDLAYRAYDLDGFSLDANGFFLMGNSGVAGVDFVFPNNTIQNGADAVAIYDTSSFVILSFTTTINLVDAIVYGTDNADDTGLLTGLEQTVQYNENENGLGESQSISRSTDCGSSIVAQNPTPNASNGMSSCPVLTAAAPAAQVTNSTCTVAGGTPSGGMIAAPVGTCPTGSTLQYSTDDGDTWSATVPTYDQAGPAQIVLTRCNCNATPATSSPTNSVTTIPGICPTPPNDLCVNATLITNLSGGNICGTTIGATADTPNEGANCGTFADGQGAGVWYTLVGTGASIDFFFPQQGETWDPEVNVYSGTCGSLTCVVGDDDSGGGLNAQFTLNTVAGTTYYMYVHPADDFGNGTSDFCFNATSTSVCPTFSGAPANVTIVNSTCNPSCVATGGSITAPSGTPCPAGSTLQYQVNSGSWTTTVPTYNTTGPAQTIKTRCSCDSDNTMNSTESVAVTTIPAICTDLILPTITCPGNIAVANTTGLCSAVASYTTPVGMDNCSNPTTIQTLGLPSGASYPVGATTNIFKVTDGAGNTATCAFAVSVTDIQRPTITCPSNIQVANTTGLCSAIVSYATPAGTDNCSNPSTMQTTGSPSGASYPVGATINIFKVTDATGNTATCAFAVIVFDTQLPTISCPANIAVANTTGQCGAVVTYTTPVGTDNCSNPNTFQTSGLPTGAQFPVGSTITGFRVMDGAGNTATCTFTVTVTDTQLPTITCPANMAVGNTPGLCSATVTYTTPVGADNCSSPGTIQTSGLPTGAPFPVGSTITGFRVMDGAGNTATCTFTVTVSDTELPTITCPSNRMVNAEPNLCSSVQTYTVTASDNCGAVTTTQTAGLVSGSAFQVGITTNSFTATDGVGLTAICSFSITVVDNQNPSIVCPLNVTKVTDAGQCTALVTYPNPNFSDNCPGAYLTRTSGQASGAAFPKGVTMVNWKATDASGNTSICGFTVTIIDTQLPTITCPANIVKNTDAGLCSAVVTYATPTFTDNCTGASLAPVSGGASGSAFQKGTNTVIWSATDAAGGTKTCSFTVIVNDNLAPVVSCPANQTKVADAGLCTALVTYTTPTFTDNCAGGTVAIQSGLASGTAFPKGMTTVVWRATDAVGLTKTCTFRVTVNDAQAPTITCPANQAKTTDPNLCTAVATYTTATFTDNCAGGSVVKLSGLASGGAFPTGVNNVVFKATDASGNQSLCTMTVTVTDAQLPTITCPSNMAVTGTIANGVCSATVTYTNPVATDNCGTSSNYLWSGLASGSVFPLGITTNVWKATDDGGLTATCAFTVTVGCGAAPEGTKNEERGAMNEEHSGDAPFIVRSLSLQLAPNPATTDVLVIVDGLDENGGILTVFDATGRVVWQQKITSSQRIQLSEFSSGVYQVSLCTEKEMITKSVKVNRL